MSHLPTLIADLALILISASVITLLFKWIKVQKRESMLNKIASMFLIPHTVIKSRFK